MFTEREPEVRTLRKHGCTCAACLSHMCVCACVTACMSHMAGAAMQTGLSLIFFPVNLEFAISGIRDPRPPPRDPCDPRCLLTPAPKPSSLISVLRVCEPDRINSRGFKETTRFHHGSGIATGYDNMERFQGSAEEPTSWRGLLHLN